MIKSNPSYLNDIIEVQIPKKSQKEVVLDLRLQNKIILLHGGIITVKSKVNEGTEFTVSIPIKQ